MQVKLESVTVKRGDKVVFKDLTAVFSGPGLYQVIGPNGSGKTTLLLTIIGRIKPVHGRVIIDNIIVKNSKLVKGFISYMPQYYIIPVDAPITLYEFIENLAGVLGKNSNSVEEILKLTGISKEYWFKKLSQLSGGLLQRTMLARTLILDTPIILLDEPFSNIDPEGKVELSEYIGKLSEKKLVITTSHDPTLLLEYTEKILVLGPGGYAFGDVEEILKIEVLGKFYKKCAIELQRHVHVIDWH
jgi:zinc/manganese transport system ATP-binding protein